MTLHNSESVSQAEDYLTKLQNEVSNFALTGFGTADALGLLAAIMEYTPLMMSFIDTQFRYVLVSRTTAEYLGQQPSDLVGRSAFEGRSETAQFLRPILQEVIDTAQPYLARGVKVPFSAPQPDDQSGRYWNFSYTPVLGEAQQVIGVLTITEDVTEQELRRRQLEQVALQEKARSAQLEAIIGSVSEGLLVINPEGEIILANQMVDEILGRPMLGQNPFRDGPAAYNRRRLDGTPMRRDETMSARVLRGETFADYRFIIETTRGEDRYVSTSGTPLYDEQGQLQAGVLLFRDVTAQEQQLRELEEAKLATDEAQKALLDLAAAAAGVTNLDQLLQQIVEIVPKVTGCDRVGIALYDSKTELLTNMAVFGLENEQQVEEWKALPPSPRDRTSPFDKHFFEEHKSLALDIEQLEAEARKRGEELPNPYGIKTMFALPLVYKGEMLGMLTLDHNGKSHTFTAREIQVLEGMGRLAAIAIQNIRLLQEANQAATLREANRLKDEFLSLVAHELRNPLTAVQGYTQMVQRRLRKAGIPEENLHPLETIIGQAQRMTRLVEDLLDLSRLETGRLELRVEECDLAEQLSRAIETYTVDNTTHKLSLELASGPDHALYTGQFDCLRLDQVISNLISNAIKYSPEGGLIRVRLTRRPQSQSDLLADKAVEHKEVIHLSIRDQGIGIPVEQQAALFNRFYRATNSRDSGLPGLGLGLYISSQIIHLHGGRMWAESAGEGQGSTFHFVLPL